MTRVMTPGSTSIPKAITHPPPPDRDVDPAALARDLAEAVEGEVRFDAGSRAAYSTDASNYRQVPIAVVVPRTVEAGVTAIAVCRGHNAPIVSRGGGTSLAGQCTNTAVVLDWSKYCHRLLEVDPDNRTCLVEPGIVLDTLNEQLRVTGLEFGPRPSTHNHCALGGMIGNNACGATAQRTGKVADNIVELEVLCYDGTRMWVGETSDELYERIQRDGGRPAEIYRQLRALRERYLEQIRTRYVKIPRRVSGYNLESLLPENNFHVAEALVGSEGTLVAILRARLKLVPVVKAKAMVLLGYPDIAAAGDAVPQALASRPIALEAMDDKLIDYQRRKNLNPEATRDLPKAGAWLMAQMGGDNERQAVNAAHELIRGLGRRLDEPMVSLLSDPDRQHEMWQVRESGLGATARIPHVADTWPGWEDSAVAPEHLGDYLRGLAELLREFGYDEASLYGHFGQGCVHTRIPFDLITAEGIRQFRSFMQRATDLVVSFGGSLSGEHGDGQARAELLSRMFGPELVTAFGQVKAIFDPGDRMNPGKVSAPYPLDSFLRLGTDYNHGNVDTHFGYPDDHGNFGRAVQRCVGVGECRRPSGGVMCPSYMVTREEEHSTRGRARLLFEMLDGTRRGGVIADGWRSTAVRDALDLCLACKGCKADCPVNVDMATYKAEFLSHHYAGRLRPAAHYTMGWLPIWVALAAKAPSAVNALSHAPGLARLGKLAGGVDQRRDVPLFARQTFQQWSRTRTPRGIGLRGDVVLWPDTFTNHFHPGIAQAAVEVIESAGWRVRVPVKRVCCGLTWISTGQLPTAKRVLRRTLDVLRPHLQAGHLIVGLEPSCTAVFRQDAHDLLPDDEDVQRLRKQTVTLAELLHERSPGWQPPHLDRTALIQTHCHQHAIMGFEPDRALLDKVGINARILDSGCCGLAGNFGFERDHFEVSQACAERVLLPEIRGADLHDVVLADGFSCRTQIEQALPEGRRAIHLAELLKAGLRGDANQPLPELDWATRQPPPTRAAGGVAAGAVAAALGLLAVGVGALLRRRRS